MSRTHSGAIKTAIAGAAIGLAASLIENSRLKTALLSAAMLVLALSLAWCIVSRLIKGRSFKSIKSIGADILHLGILIAIAGLAVYLNNPPPQLVYIGEGEGFKTQKQYLVAEKLITNKKGNLITLTGYDEQNNRITIKANRPHKMGKKLVYLWTHAESRLIIDINGEKRALYPGQELVAGKNIIKIDKDKIYINNKPYAIFTGKLTEEIKITALQEGSFAGLLVKQTAGYTAVFAGIVLSLAGILLLSISRIKGRAHV